MLVFVLSLGCVDSKDTVPTDAADTADTAEIDTAETDTAPDEVSWTDCGDGTECADIPVPLDHGDPDGEPIEIHVRRLPTTRTATRALWLVVGGPGDAGTPIVPAIAFFQDAFPTLEVYGFDHRGTGESAAIHCPLEESAESQGGVSIVDAEWAGCAASLGDAPARRDDRVASGG